MRKLLLATILLLPIAVRAQQKIGNNVTSIDTAAILELEHPNKALYLTRVSLTSTSDVITVPNPKAGMVVYNNNASISSSNPVYSANGRGVYYFDGTGWVYTGSGGVGLTNYWSLNGNSNAVDGVNFLGTTNNVALNFRVFNNKAGRIDLEGNTLLGYLAGTNLTVGLTLNNTLIGSGAGSGVTSGSNNVGIGTQALQNIGLGFNNVAVGYRAGATYANTNHNTYLGDSTDVTTAGINNATAVGSGAKVSQSNSVILGNSAASVGIGNTAPTNKLHVTGTDPLRLEGLQGIGSAGLSGTDSVLTATATGVVKKLGVASVLQPIKANNGLTRVADSIQLGGTLTKPTTIAQGGNTLTFTGGDISVTGNTTTTGNARVNGNDTVTGNTKLNTLTVSGLTSGSVLDSIVTINNATGVINKRNVNDVLSAIKANNGLTRNNDSIQLGGTLTKPTSIQTNGNNLDLFGTGNLGVQAGVNAGTVTTSTTLAVGTSATVGTNLSVVGTVKAAADTVSGNTQTGSLTVVGNTTAGGNTRTSTLTATGLGKGVLTDSLLNITTGGVVRKVSPIDLVANSVQADNGLSIGTGANAGKVILGGTLNQPTTIATGGNNLSITGTGNLSVADTVVAGSLLVNGNARVNGTDTVIGATTLLGGATVSNPSGTGLTVNNGIITNGGAAINGGATISSPISPALTVNNGATINQAVLLTGTLTATGLAQGVSTDSILNITASGVVRKVAPASLPNNIKANNGLTRVADSIQLGGTLSQNTTIVTAGNNLSLTGTGNLSVGGNVSAANLSSNGNTSTATLTATGITQGNSTDSLLNITAAGVVTKVAPASIPNNIKANNGLTRVADSIQLGGTLTKATTIATGGNNLSLTGSGNLSVGGNVSAANLSSNGNTSTATLTATGITQGVSTDSILNITAGGIVRKVAPASLPNNIKANNGLTRVADSIQLGGTLTQATTISTTPANSLTVGGTGNLNVTNTVNAGSAIVNGNTQTSTLTATGITQGTSTDSVLNITAAGIVRKVAPASLPNNIKANNGLTRVADSIQLGGTLTKATTIATGGNDLSLTGAGNLNVGGNVNAANVNATSNTSTSTLTATGITQGVSTDSVLNITAAGVVRKVAPASLPNNIKANNGLTRVADSIQLGGTLSKLTTIATAGNDLNLTGAGNLNVGGNVSAANFSTGGNATVGGNTQTNTLTATGITQGTSADSVLNITAAGIVRKVAPASLPNNIKANNGLTRVADSIQLGGTLTKATTITQGGNTLSFTGGDISITGNTTTTGNNRLNGNDTVTGNITAGGAAYVGGNTNTNTLTARNLASGSVLDSIVTINASGVVNKRNVNDVLAAIKANNGLTRNADSIQLGGTLTKNTSIQTNGNTLDLFGTGNFNVQDTVSAGSLTAGKAYVSGTTSTDSLSVRNNAAIAGNTRTATLTATAIPLGVSTDSLLNISPSGVVRKVDPASIPNNIKANNGLTRVVDSIQLGGALTKATTIGTSATNTLSITGLQAGANTDSLVSVNTATGQIRRVDINTTGAITNAANGLTKVGNTVILGGTLNQQTTINQASNNLTFGGPFSSGGVSITNNLDAGTLQVLGISNLNNTNVNGFLNANGSFNANGNLINLNSLTGSLNIYNLAAGASTDSILTIDPGTSRVRKVDINTLGAITQANNGLTKTGNTVQLGGTLIKPTTIATGGNDLSVTGAGNLNVADTVSAGSLTVGGNARIAGNDTVLGNTRLNTLTVTGLTSGSVLDSVVTINNATGVVNKRNVNDLLAAIKANNGLTRVADSIQLGGTLTKNTTIDQAGNTLTFNNANITVNGPTTTNGNVRVNGNDTLVGNLTVTGAVRQNGNVTTVGNVTTTGNFNTTGNDTVSGNITAGGAAYVGGNTNTSTLTARNLASGSVLDSIVTINNATGVVNKRNVNDLLAAIKANNGLTRVADSIQLGGTLTKNTTIDQAGNTLTFNNANITVNGPTTTNGNVRVNGNDTLVGNLTVTGAVRQNGNVTTVGNVTTTGNFNTTGNDTVSGNITAGGAAYVGGNTNTSTLTARNLASGSVLDSIVTINNATGVVNKRNVNDLLAAIKANNGLTRVADSIQLGGTLTKNTTIDQAGNTLTFNNANITVNGPTTTNGNVRVNGNDTLVGNLTVTGAVRQNGNVTTVGNVTTTGNFNTTGNDTVSGNITAGGAAYVGGNTNTSTLTARNLASGSVLDSIVTINNATGVVNKRNVNDLLAAIKANNGLTRNNDSIQLGGTLTKPTTITQGGNTLTFTGGDISITGNTTTTGNVRINGNDTLVGNFTVTGAVRQNGNVTTVGNVTTTGNFNITGNDTVSGNITAGGAAYVGGNTNTSTLTARNLASGSVLDSIVTINNATGVVNKRNVNDLLAAIKANNGLTRVADSIQLGGTLTKNTKITSDNFNLAVNGGKNTLNANSLASVFDVTNTTATTNGTIGIASTSIMVDTSSDPGFRLAWGSYSSSASKNADAQVVAGFNEAATTAAGASDGSKAIGVVGNAHAYGTAAGTQARVIGVTGAADFAPASGTSNFNGIGINGYTGDNTTGVTVGGNFDGTGSINTQFGVIGSVEGTVPYQVMFDPLLANYKIGIAAVNLNPTPGANSLALYSSGAVRMAGLAGVVNADTVLASDLAGNVRRVPAAILSSNIKANNGLTRVADSIQLGGTLTKPTTITQNGNTLTFTGGNISITGNTTTTGIVRVTGNDTVSGNITAGGAAYVGGNTNTSTLTARNLASGSVLDSIVTINNATGVVNKRNVNDLLAAIKANNGLTRVADSIQLGGTLTKPTTITQGGNSLTFTGGDISITGNTTTTGNVRINGNDTLVGNFTVTGAVRQNGNVTTVGNVTTTGNFNTTGNDTVSGNITAGGAAYVGGNTNTSTLTARNLASGSVLDSIVTINNATGVVNKRNVNDLLAAIKANNGLTRVADSIQLGGTLTKPTTITQGGNTLTFTGGDISITGNTTTTGIVRVTGNDTVSGNVTAGGAAYVGGNTNTSTLTARNLASGSVLDSIVTINFATGVVNRRNVNDVLSAIKANNGLTRNNDSIQLGGTLTKPTTITQGGNTLTFTGGDISITGNTTTTGNVRINGNDTLVGNFTLTGAVRQNGNVTTVGNVTTTGNFNTTGNDTVSGNVTAGGAAYVGGNTNTSTLTARNLASGSVLDSVVTINNATGVVNKRNVNDLLAAIKANNGLTRVADSIQLGGTLTKATSIQTNGNNLDLFGTGNFSVADTVSAGALTVSGNARVAGNDTVLGNTRLNTLTVTGLTSGSVLDSIVTIDNATGVVNKRNVNDLLAAIKANNGLTRVADSIQLGGTLTKATTVATSNTNTLALTGLQAGTTTDSLVTIIPSTGVLRRVDINTTGAVTNAGNGLRKVGNTIILGGKLDSSTVINTSTYNLTVGGPSSSGGLSVSNKLDAGELQVLSLSTLNNTNVNGFLQANGSFVANGNIINLNSPSGNVTINNLANGAITDSILTLDVAGGNKVRKVNINTLGALTAANNGLTKTGNTVQLGGTLIQSTTIATGGNDLSVTGTGNLNVADTVSAGSLTVSGNARIAGNDTVIGNSVAGSYWTAGNTRTNTLTAVGIANTTNVTDSLLNISSTGVVSKVAPGLLKVHVLTAGGTINGTDQVVMINSSTNPTPNAASINVTLPPLVEGKQIIINNIGSDAVNLGGTVYNNAVPYTTAPAGAQLTLVGVTSAGVPAGYYIISGL